jgi:predicted transcriptional regulator
LWKKKAIWIALKRKKLSEAAVSSEKLRQQTEADRRDQILQAQELFARGLSRTEISKVLDIPIKRLRRYLSGDANLLCKDGRSYIQKTSRLDAYSEIIGNLLKSKMTYREIHQHLSNMGVAISYSTLCKYCVSQSGKEQRTLANPPIQHSVSRRDIFEHIWSGSKLEPFDEAWLFEKHPHLLLLSYYVTSFRLAFHNACILEAWIFDAMHAPIPAIRSLAAGLNRDKTAVLNSTKFSESNAFLEGNINRLKMIKRSMFGRASLELLSVKVVGCVIVT